MSADNWARCPKCTPSRRTREEKLAEAYGKVPIEQYAKLLSEVKTDDDRRSLREDYEIGIRDGRFRVDYGASCEACGFQFFFKHEEPAKEAGR